MRLKGSILLCLAIAAYGAATASVPPVISYQGKLMQPSGVPVPDATCSITFGVSGFEERMQTHARRYRTLFRSGNPETNPTHLRRNASSAGASPSLPQSP